MPDDTGRSHDRHAVIENIITDTDGVGRWRAALAFRHTLSETDPRVEFNINARLAELRRAARLAMLDELVLREQKTNETRSDAERRLRAVLRVEIVAQKIDAQGRWHGITFAEKIIHRR